MKAAVINTKQKKKTLASQAKHQQRKKACARNVLASSLPRTSFKGCVVKDSVQFEKELSQIFRYQLPVTHNWSLLKLYNKEERRALKKIGNKVPPSRAYVALGINQVTRAVETRTATAVILTDDVNPAMLIKHFQQCCDIYKIPLFIVKNLRLILRRCVGFSSMAMALKEIPKSDPLYEFYEYLEHCCPSEWERTKTKPSIQVDLVEVSDEEQVLPKTENETTENEQPAMEIVIKEENDVYLYRNKNERRCFYVPAPNKEKDKILEEDFIAFNAKGNEETVVPFVHRSQRLKQFLKARIRRLQANANRIKK